MSELSIFGSQRYSQAESYRGESDNGRYMEYLRGEHREPVGVETGQIMQEWTASPMVSEGFYSCYPLVAFERGKGQMIHMSRDLWRQTNTDEYWDQLRMWQARGSEVAMFRTRKSALSGGELETIRSMFGAKFSELGVDTDSRYGLVVNTQSKLLLVQLTDLKMMLTYKV